MRRRLVIFAVVAGFVVSTSVTPAVADPISDAQREARRIAGQLDALQSKAEQLAEDYNDARLQLADLESQVADTTARLESNRAATQVVQKRMGSWAVNAYTTAAGGDPVFAAFDENDNSASVEGYSAIAVGADAELADQLRQGRDDTTVLEAELTDQTAAEAALKKALATKKTAAEKAVSTQETLLATTNRQVAALIEQERERKAAEEQQRIKAAIEARAAARRAAATQGSASGSGGASTSGSNHNPPPPSPGAAGAVAQAMSQIGVRYRWGQDDPGSGFDCSGLTSWAWGRAGTALPHSSRAQWDSLTRVDPEDLQPGDLVFFGSPVHHVGLYIGNGQMVHAPHSGDVVKVATIYRGDLRGGGRP